ncbi:MAG TPA: GspMb/PilO family protein [Acidobacteriaceae bacterium]|nr:GspMb/PilO family protein [Acidobacteriaceae bacterium]
MKSLRSLISLLNLHFAGVALLLILNLVLAVRLFLAWSTLRSAGADQLSQQQTALRALQLEMSPLKGLPQKVDLSRTQANDFFGARFPAAYSTISATINDLAAKNSVHVTNLSYNPARAPEGLVELRLDASLSGEYAPLMHFINGLERSKTFFLISGLTLTGQQGGLVNLRLRVNTYLHATNSNQLIPVVQGDDAATQGGDR